MGSDLTDFLSALEPRVVDVKITLSHGGSVTIKLGTLTMHEWDMYGEFVKDPLAPFVSHNVRGEEIRNYNAPEYLAARRAGEVTRAYRRLTLALVRGGNEIKGDLFEDKVEEVRERLDLAIAAALMRWQSALVSEGRVAILNAAERFPNVEEAFDARSIASEDIATSLAKPDGVGTE
jgi:hypothetical protein